MEVRCLALSALLAASCSSAAGSSTDAHASLTRGYPAIDDLTELMHELPGLDNLTGNVSKWCEAGPELAMTAQAVQRSATDLYSAESEELLAATKRFRDECASTPETELVPRIHFMLDRLARIRKHSGHSDPR